MPIHDWTRVGAGIFHDFHHTWIAELKLALNAGLLPAGYYALAEQIAGGFGPDVLALEGPPQENPGEASSPQGGGVAVALLPPKVQFQVRAEIDWYVPVPLDATCESAWQAVPSIWREALTGRAQ